MLMVNNSKYQIKIETPNPVFTGHPCKNGTPFLFKCDKRAIVSNSQTNLREPLKMFGLIENFTLENNKNRIWYCQMCFE